MGLHDQYTDKYVNGQLVSDPNAGWDGAIMAEVGGTAMVVGPGGKNAIDLVVDRNGGCPCECQLHTVIK